VVGVEEKGEKKMDTIHLLPRCCWLRPECLRSHGVLYFANFAMKFGGVVYHVVIFSNCPLLLDLKLSAEICASLSGRRSVASHVKGQRLRPTIEDG